MRPFRRARRAPKHRQPPPRRAAAETPAPRRQAGEEQAPRRRAQRKPAAGGLGRALRSSGAAAGKGLGATATRARLARPIVDRGAALAGRVLRPLYVFVLRLAALLERLLRGGTRAVAALVGGLTAWLARVVTPERAVVAVTLAAAACLVVSQFSDYRGVEVGQPAYAEVESIAPAPQVDVKTAGDAHAYLLIPVAVIAALLSLVALATRRWQLGRLVAIAGLIGVGVALLIDLPKGLDEGAAGVGYAGAHATLADGFYAQLAAAAVLCLCGVLLAVNLRRASGPARRRRARRRAPRRRNAPSLARTGS